MSNWHKPVVSRTEKRMTSYNRAGRMPTAPIRHRLRAASRISYAARRRTPEIVVNGPLRGTRNQVHNTRGHRQHDEKRHHDPSMTPATRTPFDLRQLGRPIALKADLALRRCRTFVLGSSGEATPRQNAVKTTRRSFCASGTAVAAAPYHLPRRPARKVSEPPCASAMKPNNVECRPSSYGANSSFCGNGCDATRRHSKRPPKAGQTCSLQIR